MVPIRSGGREVSDFADPAAIIGAFALIYAVLRWVDYAGTRVAARHPRSCGYVGSQVIEPVVFPEGFDPPSAAPWPPGLRRH
jgi:hypothetical protein